MRKIPILCSMSLLACSLTFGQVDISGKVVDQDSIPLAGARVALAAANCEAVSAQDGSFRIYRFSNPVRRPLRPGAGDRGMSLVNGMLRVPLSSDQDRVCVSLYDLNGRKVRGLTRTGASAGTQMIDLSRELVSGLPTGACVLRVEAGREKTTLRALVTERGLQATGAGGGMVESGSTSLARSSAVVDTLTVSRNGYESRQIPVATYSVSNLLLSLTALRLDFALKVEGLAARYDVSNDNVTLTWTALDQAQFTFYRIYRTSTPCVSGGPDMKTMISSGSRSVVSKSLSSFTDIPGLDNGMHYYCIRPVKVTSGDTALGLMSAPAAVLVGSDVKFTINRSDLFTTTDRCSLIISDPFDTLQSVRFSQQYLQYLVKASGARTAVSFDDPVNPPASSVLNSLITDGWLSSDGKLYPGVLRSDVPDFGAPDPLNTIRSYQSMQSKSFSWTLLQGNGTKRVWAELTYKGGMVDTLMDAIEIAPCSISVELGSSVISDPTVKKESSFQATTYFLHRPWIDFAVSIFGDTTVSLDFNYWVMIPDSISTVYEEIRDISNSVLESVPRKGSLTGYGPAHNSQQQYRYVVDPTSAEGGVNLARFRRTFLTPTKSGSIAFKLRDDNDGGIMNRSCVPGAYWGPTPSIYVSSTRQVTPKWDSLTLVSSSEKASRLRYMRRDQLQTRGVKEFVLITRFTGRCFGDTRVAVSGGELMPGSFNSNRAYGASSYFDWYPPNMNARVDAGIFVNNGSIITVPFSFAPASSPSIEDKGRANIARVEMVIARRPSWMPWSVYVGGYITADTLSVQTLHSLRNTVIDIPIAQQAASLSNVQWDIDPSDWAAGDYIMGVVAEDEFGNSGWASISAPTATQPYTNPWMVTKQ